MVIYIERYNRTIGSSIFQAVFKNCQEKETIYSDNFQKQNFFLFLKKEANIHKLILQKNYINYVL